MTLRWRWFCRSSTWTCRSRTHVQFIPHINILNWGSGVVIGFQTLVYPYLKPFTTWYNIYIYIHTFLAISKWLVVGGWFVRVRHMLGSPKLHLQKQRRPKWRWKHAYPRSHMAKSPGRLPKHCWCWIISGIIVICGNVFDDDDDDDIW